MDYGEFRKELTLVADDEYREFAMKGIPSERPFIGVRIPKIREIVSRVSVERFDEFLAVEPVAIEEVLARGMIIARMEYPEMVAAFDLQVELIDDWCACDTFCSGIRKTVAKHREEFYDLKIRGLIESRQEFSVRVGLVLSLGYVSEEWLPVIFEAVEKVAVREEYYVRMAVAWLVAECFIKFPEATVSYLRVSRLPAWTFNKAISKICDSYRVSEEGKEVVRGMRRNLKDE